LDLKLHFPEGKWETIQQDWSAWWAGELERPMVVLECIEAKDTSTPHYASTFLGNYGVEAAADELLELFVQRLEATYFLGDAYPRMWPNFGPGIIAAFAGAGLHAVEDTTWFSPSEKHELPELKIRMDQDNPWWKQVKAVTRRAVERWGDQLSIGITDLGGNLDILAHLRGTQQLLFDLVDAPEEVDRLVKETNLLWRECYEQLYRLTQLSRGISCWGPCWSPGRGYLLQSDFSYMISPLMFERYVLPDLAASCDSMEYAFYHLDGIGQLSHLDMLLSLERLRGIQWVPGDGQPQAECWIPIIKRILERGKLCQVYAGAKAALQILRELEGKGLLLAINETPTPEQGTGLLHEIQQLRD
jgi:5-methyltetrahydrofolate--homocysteine methyltransferase